MVVNESVRSELLAERARLERIIRDLLSEPCLDYVGEVCLAHALRQQAGVDRALQQVENGAYGTCKACGVLIPQERLQAIPEALLCVACAEQQEQVLRPRHRTWSLAVA